ncbi:MAG: peptidase M14 [Kiritimatiellaeota bacterium]|nr:peptidase M14 [Kiritimatiellota bacterium]
MAFRYLNTGFENASPLDWEIGDNGAIQIALIYDHERESPNRAVLHWHFMLEADPGDTLRLELRNFDNIWNGRPGSPIGDETPCVVSEDGRNWRTAIGRKVEGNRLELFVSLVADHLYVARIEPYRISDLERFLERIRRNELVRIEPVGTTVEGRELSIVSVGRLDAPHHVLLRGRAHPWETGGNWVIQGLIDGLLAADAGSALDAYCLHVLPMANKDGVARGMSRFNLRGCDLNRNWERPADPMLAPENRALEVWIERMISAGQRPDLVIDLHNDNGGQLHANCPEEGAELYQANMVRLEEVLRRFTWFREGRVSPNFRNPGSLGEGLCDRYGIDACILELKCLATEGLGRPPLGADWHRFGRGMRQALTAYFA